MRHFGSHPRNEMRVLLGRELRAIIKPIKASVLFGGKYNGLAYSCQHCQSILSVGIDPVALNSDLVADLMAALQKG